MGPADRLALCALLLTGSAHSADAPIAPVGLHTAVAGDWRTARWGMSLEEILAAFPGQARRIAPEIKLQDGNVVAAGFEGHVVAAQEFQVRFVFAGGKLALVSLRTPPSRYADPGVFKRVVAALASELGPPASSEADDNLIDVRQTRWNVGRTQVDLKFIPGVVVILYHPRTATPGD